MIPFESLTYLGQVRRLRGLARAALDEFGFGTAEFSLVAYSENTTFRITPADAGPTPADNQSYVENRYVLRLHRPGYQTTESIVSELTWLAALRRDTGLVVPEPMPSLTGRLVVEATAAGIPGPRSCSLLRWTKGQHLRQRLGLTSFVSLGRLMAQLHHHASEWQPPPGFERRRWDWDGLFGDHAGFALSRAEVWSLVPQPYHELFETVAGQTRQVMSELGQGAKTFGLIHADLHLGQESNVLFRGGEARPIDFDDCGFGLWVYDLAVPLCHWQASEKWTGIRDSLLAGYAQERPLPEQLAHLELFMAARHVSEILWAVDMAQVNPSFRADLDDWLEWAGLHVRRYLETS